jgi:hypothetical protein
MSKLQVTHLIRGQSLRENLFLDQSSALPEVRDVMNSLREPDRKSMEYFYGNFSQMQGVRSINLKNPPLEGTNLPKKYSGLEIAIVIYPESEITNTKEESLLRDYCRSSKHYRLGERDELKLPTSANVQNVWTLKPKGNRVPVEVGFYESNC